MQMPGANVVQYTRRGRAMAQLRPWWCGTVRAQTHGDRAAAARARPGASLSSHAQSLKHARVMTASSPSRPPSPSPALLTTRCPVKPRM